jgi:NAD(P)H-hydrate repair Nnr-like enzyme with NAD(P)H-hydrate dehydratase domain
MVAARLAAGEDAVTAASAAVYLHGLAADRWPEEVPLTASALACGGVRLRAHPTQQEQTDSSS